MYFSVHKYVFQCTNIFPVHKYVTGYDGGQVTIVFSRLTNGLPFCITKTITTDLKGLLIPYWKACFVPSVELKCKFPLHFGPVVAGA